jgi:YidC/Oxa1 family membrane protein insertase
MPQKQVVKESVQVLKNHQESHVIEDRDDLIYKTKAERLKFSNDEISGSINLRGAKLDDLILKKYHKTIKDDSDPVTLLSPSTTAEPYFITVGWVSKDRDIILPDSNTLWTSNSLNLSSESQATLHWTSPQGIRFMINFAIDDDYMFTVEQSISNNYSSAVNISPYATISRGVNGQKSENVVVHQGAIAVSDGKLHEITFDDLIKEGKADFQKGANWLGFSDKYWLSALISEDSNLDAKFSSYVVHGNHRVQADLLYATRSVDVGSSNSSSIKIFAGAKNLDVLEGYETKYNLPMFDHAVDFGILYFITKPIFLLLHMFYDYIGNFGVAILLLTVFIKMLLFPIAYKGYVGMNKLRDLQPKMSELKERYKDDAQAFQKALVDLYKREKVNPAAGCLPILMQMPVFFALYKVLYVTIEMRHAPFFGWIQDLSAPDPTSIFNLFGLISWSPPAFLMIGVFPILMSITMYIQQKLNPEPTDPVQAKMMKMLPFIFLFMFSSFPSGMVIYWAWSNLLSIIQQVVIKKITS